jgi:hypothetical protein
MKYAEITNDPRPRLLPANHAYLAVVLIECGRRPGPFRRVKESQEIRLVGFTGAELGFSTVYIACTTAEVKDWVEQQWN